jgi:outer membrane protein OmpA-like peptidoglycan-associated protein
MAAVSARAQSHADCGTALELDIDRQLITDVLGGGVQEITDTDTKSLYWFEKEHNTCWIKIPVKRSGSLTIDLHSKNNEDVDFLLFKYTNGNFCDDVKNKKIKPVRSNLSRSVNNEGRTGLSKDAKDDYVHSGPGSPFSRPLEVKQGEVYYLVIDHYSKTGGSFLLHVYVDGAPMFDPKKTIDAAPVAVDKKDLVAPTVPLRVKIVDDETRQPVKASLSVEGIIPGSPVKVDTSYFETDLGSSQNVHIDCNAKGYMFTSQSIMGPMIDPFDPSGMPAPVEVEIRIKKLKEGEKVALRNIQFQPDKADFLPSSWGDLQSLTRFLQANPSVKIEIGGHVNGPDGSSGAGKKISKKRAKAVYDYLIKRGIDKSRLKYKGYGNKEMIYPDPKNERQAEENRRVEIKVIQD